MSRKVALLQTLALLGALATGLARDAQPVEACRAECESGYTHEAVRAQGVAPDGVTVAGDVTAQPSGPIINKPGVDDTHHSAPNPLPVGAACTDAITSTVSVGPTPAVYLDPHYHPGFDDPQDRQDTKYYDPNVGHDVPGTTSVHNSIGTPAQTFVSGDGVVSQGEEGQVAASYSLAIPWTLSGTWDGTSCQGTWQRGLTRGTLRGDLPFTPPPLAQLIQGVEAHFEQQYSGGQVAAYGSNGTPATGLVVRNPTCFTEQGTAIPPKSAVAVTIPQTNAGAALLVTYVVTAGVDQVWWDTGDTNHVEQAGSTDTRGKCALQYQYGRVSSDDYKSNTTHSPPPGQSWPWGDAEPHADMRSVAVWHHVHFGVTAIYRQPSGRQVTTQLPITGQTDYWIASHPVWVTVYQIESVPINSSGPATS